MKIRMNKLVEFLVLVSLLLVFAPASVNPAPAANTTYHIDLWHDSSGHYSSAEPDFAFLLKQQLEATGYFDVSLHSTTWSQYTSQFGTMPTFMLGWFYDYFDESDYIEPFVSTAGGLSIGTNYSNPLMDSYINLMFTGSPTEKTQATKDAQALMVEDPAVIPLVTRAPNFVAASKSLSGLYLQPSDNIALGMINKTGSASAILGTTDSFGGTGSSSIDFSGCYSFGCSFALKQISRGLFELNRQTSAADPSLVQDWNVSTDGLTYIFNLKPNLYFTDGNPLTPDDAIWSLNRSVYLNETSGGPSFLLSNLNLAGRDADGLPTGHTVDMQVINGTAFSVKLKQKDSTFIKRLTYTNAYIFEKNATASNGIGGQVAYNNDGYLPVGLGPYKISSYDPTTIEVVLTRFNGYNQTILPQTGNITTFDMQHFVDSTGLYTALQAGSIDLGYHNFGTEQVLSLQGDSNFQTQSGTAFSIRYIVINVDSHPSLLVRQAMTYVFNRQQIVQQIFAGVNAPLYSMVAPGFPDACHYGDTNGSLPCYYPEQNLTMVSSLMKQAGYTGCFKALGCTLSTATTAPSTITSVATSVTTSATTVTVTPGFELITLVVVVSTGSLFVIKKKRKIE